MKHIVVLLCIVFCAGCAKDIGSVNGPGVESENSFDTVTETALPTYKYIYTSIGTDVKSGYAEVLPSLYYKTTKRYPLIIFNHGVGENGNTGKSLSGLSCCGLPYHASRGKFPAKFYNSVDGKYYSYIAIAPQYYNRPTGAQVNEVVSYAINKYRVDPSRIYVVGLSQGGGVTEQWAFLYGNKAAAIFPSCPGGVTPTVTRAQQLASTNLPVWWTYSTGDALVSYKEGYTWHRLVDSINAANASRTKLTVWDGLSHNGTWAKAFNPLTKVDGKNAYEWLLQYKREVNIPPVAVINNGSAISIPVSWNYMPTVYGTASKDSDGWIAAFKWSKVSGASCTIQSTTTGSTKITGLVAGTYTFRLTVTDNKGATSTDDIKITMTP